MIKPLRSALLVLVLLGITTACSDGNDKRPAPEPLLESYLLSSPDSVPEGVAFDPMDRAFYATSLQGGSIVRIEADGSESVFRPADGRARLVGTKVDARERRLWVCAQGVDETDNRVWVFDLDTAELAQEYLLGALSTGGSCNDLVLDDNGFAYVTDPANPFIYRLDPNSVEGEVFATDPLFTDITGFSLGLNGIAVAADGSALIVAKFAPPSLLYVSLPDGQTIHAITLSGDTFTSPDGLAVLEGDIYAVSNSVVNRVRLSTDYSSGEVVSVEQHTSGLSTATVAESGLYVIKSDVTNFVGLKELDIPFEIFKVDTAAYDQ